MDSEILRLIDAIHRDKGIDKEVILNDIEQALSSAFQSQFGQDGIVVKIDRTSGQILAHDDKGEKIEVNELGRIIAQTAKHVILQMIKDAESDVVKLSFDNRVGQMVSGTVQRFDRGDIITSVSKTEAVLPKKEQVPGETYRMGDHVKAVIQKVKKQGSKVRIILSRADINFVKRLFELEIPEISDKTIEIKEISREAGFRTKLAVYSSNPKIDPVGACVGVRGNRIKNIVEELSTEKIDIIKWDEKPEVFIPNAMKPAEVRAIEIDADNRRAKIFVAPDQLSLAIGRRGQNIRLASQLVGWEIDVASTEELDNPDKAEEAVKSDPENSGKTVEESK
ncbi:MAG: transcription termination factor NusA [Candidatus Brocadiia bacterium]